MGYTFRGHVFLVHAYIDKVMAVILVMWTGKIIDIFIPLFLQSLFVKLVFDLPDGS